MTYGFNSISRSLILAGALAFGALPAFAQSGTTTVGVQPPAASATVGASTTVAPEKKAEMKTDAKAGVKADTKATVSAKDKQSSNTKVQHKAKIMHRADATPAKKDEVKLLGKVEAKPAIKAGEKAATTPVEKKAEPVAPSKL